MESGVVVLVGAKITVLVSQSVERACVSLVIMGIIVREVCIFVLKF